MTTALIVGGAVALLLGIVLLFLRYLEGRVDRVSTQQQEVVERISTLEVNDYAQDARLDRQQHIVKRLTRNVQEIGEDVGWDGGWGDDGRKTELSKTVVMLDPLSPIKKPPDEPPDDAA